MSEEILLELQNVSLSYGSSLILRDISVKINKVTDHGKIICFLGPSGIGKTQLTRIIAGLQKPTSGRVLLHGQDVMPGMACVVPQAYPMFEYMTTEGNLLIAGRQAGLTDIQSRTKMAQLIEEFGLGEHLLKYPAELSGGTKQRVAIARQLMCATHYMVMDEPFSGLDPIMKAKAAEAILTLAQQDTYGVTIVVTHDIKQGLLVADRVWLMGYEKDGDRFIPGARLIEDHDMAEMGLAWTPDLERNPKFIDLLHHIEDRFKTLR